MKARKTPEEFLDMLLGLQNSSSPSQRKREKVGDLLNQLRIRLAMSPTEFARAAGVSVQTIHRWLRGHLPRRHWLEKIRRLCASGAGQIGCGSSTPVTVARLIIDIRLEMKPGKQPNW